MQNEIMVTGTELDKTDSFNPFVPENQYLKQVRNFGVKHPPQPCVRLAGVKVYNQN